MFMLNKISESESESIFDAKYVNSIHACLLVTCDIIKSCYTLYISHNYIFQNEAIM